VVNVHSTIYEAASCSAVHFYSYIVARNTLDEATSQKSHTTDRAR